MASSSEPADSKVSGRNALDEVRSLGKEDADDADSCTTLNDKRRATLAEIDNARFSWFHVRVCLIAGVGFFTDSYDIFAISIASVMLGYVYGHGQQLSANQDLGIKVATPVGTVVGQLLFGWLADVFGRKPIYGYELMLMIVASFGQALAGQAHGANIIGVLVVWRFIMGVGIGGDYPLSSVIPAEFSSTRIRGRMLTAVGANQGWGQLTAALVSFIITRAYKPALLADDPHVLAHVDFMWRLLIGLGCVPGAIALYFRLTIPETPRFTMDVERNVRRAARDVTRVIVEGGTVGAAYYVDGEGDAVIRRVRAPKATRRDFMKYFSRKENLVPLLGMCYSWFAIDVAFYGLGLNTSIILQAIGFGSPSATVTGVEAVYENLKNIAVGNMILAVAGLIPGAWTTFLFIDHWGRKPIQLLGFVMLTILYIIMGFSYHDLTATSAGRKTFVFLYCLTNFFSNFGPNSTVSVFPGESFPTRYRSTAFGIAAASGKVGAVVSQVGFGKLVNIGGENAFVPHLLEIFAFFMLTGALSTLVLKEGKRLTLEELSNEKQEQFIQGLSGP
ncbi:phosphate transporter [Cubamyces sp. BRFM 1775]|nr:phosphate transporter [Cubamyces sp. BRFM 1775]